MLGFDWSRKEKRGRRQGVGVACLSRCTLLSRDFYWAKVFEFIFILFNVCRLYLKERNQNLALIRLKRFKILL